VEFSRLPPTPKLFACSWLSNYSTYPPTGNSSAPVLQVRCRASEQGELCPGSHSSPVLSAASWPPVLAREFLGVSKCSRATPGLGSLVLLLASIATSWPIALFPLPRALSHPRTRSGGAGQRGGQQGPGREGGAGPDMWGTRQPPLHSIWDPFGSPRT
jgi:hypothetical protein